MEVKADKGVQWMGYCHEALSPLVWSGNRNNGSQGCQGSAVDGE